MQPSAAGHSQARAVARGVKSIVMNYRWNCAVCNSTNEPKLEFCENCGCPAMASGEFIEGWKNSLEQPSEHPSVNWMNGMLSHKVAPCPKCSLHMIVTDASCPHCGYVLSMSQRHALSSHYKHEFAFGRKWALLLFPLLILAVIYVHQNF